MADVKFYKHFLYFLIFVKVQPVRTKVTDRQTDRQTDRHRNGQAYSYRQNVADLSKNFSVDFLLLLDGF